MPVKFLDAMAQAIYFYEGHQPQDANHRNNNPGNLRPWPGCAYPVSAEGFVVFPDFLTGYSHLLTDLECKIAGHNEHGLDLDSSLYDLLAVYAPSSDHNKPASYAKFVEWWLNETYERQFDATDTFRIILETIGQQVD